MEIKPKITFHNRFDIEVRNAVTGELKQKAQAENIILDAMYSRLCNASSYFEYIHFGTGTGTPTADRTSLFTHLGTKSAVNDEQVKTYPTASWKQKIVLAPEEYVGETLTEVGIAYDSTSTHLLTHAMIKDSEGTTISITKTALDVVTIYATVFVTFSTNVIWVSDNSLMNYLIGGTTIPGSHLELLPCPVDSTALGNTSDVSWTADVANKKRKLDVKRFGIDDANGNVLGFKLENMFVLGFPAAGIHEGSTYTGVALGTGDGNEDEFALPSHNLKSGTLTVKIDGVSTSAISLNEAPLYKTIITPPNAPTYGQDVALSSDGSVLAVAGASDTPYVKVYDWDDGWTERAALPNLPHNGYAVELSSDGSVLAVGTLGNTPYIKVYDWGGSSWTERATPPNAPEYGAYVALSSDGSVLAVSSHTTTPYVKVYDWGGSSWTERATPPNALTDGQNVALSSDGSILAMASGIASPDVNVKVYDWDGSSWTERATPPNLSSWANSLALSSDGSVLAISTLSVAPYFKVYDNQYASQTTVIFDTAPAQDAVLTADYTVKGVHKTTNQVIDISASIQFGEPV